MLQKIGKILGGDSNKKNLTKFNQLVDQINALEKGFEDLSEDGLKGKTDDFRKKLSDGADLDDILVEAFAAVREASKRTLGLRHYDVQILGGIVLHKGIIAEMKTGEGKTLAATLPLYLNALSDKGAHLVTVNDYLARRDARWMAPIYDALGLSVGVLQMASRTENSKKAYIVDLKKESPHEDQHQLRMVDRVEAYNADITYGTNNEFGFDYLRDNLAMRLSDRVQRGHHYAIVDEVDNILIDEARTPLIISGPAQDEAANYVRMAQIVRQLRAEDYEVSEKDHAVSLTEMGEAHCEELLNTSLRDPERPEDITPEQARLLGYLQQALRAQFLFRRNKDYLVQAGKVVIVDEFTGRLMPGRRWSEGLHQAVEAKEGVRVEPENITYATITLQNYFRMYEKLAGMTGTAETEAEEFRKIYKLEVMSIPTNLEYIAMRPGSELIVFEDRDEENYKYQYYAKRDDQERAAVYWRRKDFPDMVYRTEEAKLRAITLEILRYHVIGRPQLVGTTSVEHSERLSDRLDAEPLRRLAQTVLIRETWLEKSGSSGETDIKELRFMSKPVDQLNTGEMRQVARELEIVSMNPDEAENVKKLSEVLHLGEQDAPRLVRALQAGVPRQVLNARKHDEEAQIIAQAGAFGAVTIATNMAGRGVDIKLGGQLRDDITADVIHVLSRAGMDPYDQPLQTLRQMLDRIPKEEWSIYEGSIQAFYQYLDDMKRVRELGGLHVIGSERHEARRIDNQLRGRSARQGDPGSSRFYLSLEDELMRLFGGNRAETLMRMFNIDPSVPIESGVLGRLVEQAQERVEGNNFDIRKHLLEYDDVLNNQRKRIYEERDRVFTKEDLRQDVLDMLHTELQTRIATGMDDPEGPWKLLAYLEEIQPTIYFEQEKTLVPSFTLRLVLERLKDGLKGKADDRERLRTLLLEIARESLSTEKEHLLKGARQLIKKTESTYQGQVKEREETIDTYFDALRDREEGEQVKRPQEMLDELSGMLHVPLRLAAEELVQLPESGSGAKSAIRQQVDSSILVMNFTRLLGAFERRLDEPLNIKPAELTDQSWKAAADMLLKVIESIFDRRTERLVGENGVIVQNVTNLVARQQDRDIDQGLLVMLMLMAHGVKMEINTQTHKRGWRRITLLNYIFLAAHALEQADPEPIVEKILKHLEGTLDVLKGVWGQIEYNRLAQMGATLPLLEQGARSFFERGLGKEKVTALAMRPLADLSSQEKNDVLPVMGERVQNEIYRQILLGAISDLWVDYLTRMEALRVSISLESYAQRDPLVMYKSRASELFGNLLSEIRLGVISRMFIVSPRRGQLSQQAQSQQPAVQSNPPSAESPAPQQEGGGKKRKRHRH
jgi:preprotein translocase subunit SecA